MDGAPQNGPEDQDREAEPGETYTPIEAGRVLGVSGERIRQLLEAKEIAGEKRGGRWRVYRVSVHEALSERGSPRARRSRERSPHESGEDAARELRARVEDLSYKLGRSEARAELTERAESTVREALERERERADRLEAELRETRDQIEASRRRGFWSRLFGS
jgi:excisionase family DNA binding protein